MSFDTQPENLAIDPKTTAIVLIEFQNDLFILRSTALKYDFPTFSKPMSAEAFLAQV